MKRNTEVKLKILGYFFMVLLTTISIVSRVLNYILFSVPIYTIDMISTASLFVVFLSLMIQYIKELKKTVI